MKTTTTKQKNFTMISDKLCRVPIKKISQTEKLYIAYILRYQANGNTLFASNKSIGEQLGIDGGSVKKLNNKMNKQYNFFSAIQDKKYDNGIEYSSSHTIKVDEKLLDEFLDNVSTFIKEKPKTQNKAPEATILTKPIPEVQVEEIVPQIEDNEDLDTIEEDIEDIIEEDNSNEKEKSVFEMSLKELVNSPNSDYLIGTNYVPQALVEFIPLIEGKQGLLNQLIKKYDKESFVYKLREILESKKN